MIGILGGMGTQAGLDYCEKLAMLNRGKIDQEYPLSFFIINQIFQVGQSLSDHIPVRFLSFLKNLKI